MADQEFLLPEDQKKLFAEWKEDETLRRNGGHGANRNRPEQRDHASAPAPPPLPVSKTLEQEIADLIEAFTRLRELCAMTSPSAIKEFDVKWQANPLTPEVCWPR